TLEYNTKSRPAGEIRSGGQATPRAVDMAPSAGRSACSLSPHELLTPIPLRVEQCGEVAVVDPRGGRGGDGGLGVVGDAEAGTFDHAEIVGTVADHQRVDVVEIERLPQFVQGGEFGGAAYHRLGDLAGEF